MKLRPVRALCAAACFLAVPISHAQSLRVYPAIELVFPTMTNVIYQLESSEDLTVWKRFGGKIIGEGEDFSLLVSTRNTRPSFFRLSGPLNAPGLVAFYKFEGDGADSTTNANHGASFDPIQTTNRFGRAGAAYYFPGVPDSFVRIPNSPSLNLSNAATLAAWVNFDAAGFISSRIVMKDSYDLALADAGFTERRPGFTVKTPAENLLLTSTKVTQAGEWHLIVGTYDGSTMRLFVDGVQAAERPATGDITPTSSDLMIGRNSENGLDFFQGTIDDIRIYNRALSSAEIAELFHESE